MTARPRIACLLPVRNGAAYLPGWFESVERFADTVVALDDGSTDDSAALLESHPLVSVLLRNTPRPTYAGWDDAGNRNRLMAATTAGDPDWIMFLDVDERIDPDDAAALERFVSREAVECCAYGMRLFSMLSEPGGTYDPEMSRWVYRLFAFRPGQQLRPRRLHDVPVPADIPPTHWVRTTLRLQHLGAATPALRRSRYAKYAEADPERRWQSSYEHLLDESRASRRFERRPPQQPLLAQVSPLCRPQPNGDGPTPALSAIVISRNDESRIERAVGSVVAQECPEPFEVIVVTSGTDATAEIVRSKFPQVRVVELDGVALPGAARNAGLLHARGEFVSFPGSHVELPPGSLAARLDAHRQGYAMVTGTTLNGTRTAAGWASYFLDHSTVLPHRPSEPLDHPPVHCSYVREHLFDVGGFREDIRVGEDTLVNRELWRRGHRATLGRHVRFVHNTPCGSARRLVTHHFERGRGLGRIEATDLGEWPPAWRIYLAARCAAIYSPARLLKVSGDVRRFGGPLRRVHRRVLALIVLGTVAANAGLCVELLLAGARMRPRIFRRWTAPTREVGSRRRAQMPAKSARKLPTAP